MKTTLTFLICLIVALCYGQTVPIQVNRTTSVLASPLNAWSANAAGISTALGLGTAATHPDTDFQFYDAELAAFAGLTSAADALPYFTGTATMATTPLSAFMRTVLDDVDAATVRATLGVGTGSGSVTDVSVVSANGFSGTVANSTTTPAITIVAGAITPTTVNGNTITAGTGTLTLGSATLNAGLGGTLGSAAFTASTDYQASDAELTALAGLTSAADKLPYFTGSGTASLADLSSAARNVLDDASVSAMVDTLGGASSTGSGGLVRSTSPILTTPTLGVASATTLNKLTITTPTTGSTLTVDDGKTLRSTASLTLSGTDSTTMTFPASSATVAGLGIAQTFSAANTFSANGALSTPAVSITGTPITGGTATTTKPLTLIEAAGATSTFWSTSGTMLGVNAPSGFVGNVIDIGLATSLFKVNSAGNATIGGSSLLINSSGSVLNMAGDTFLYRKAAANLQLGTADAAAPVAQTLSVQSVVSGTTDTAGVNWTFNGSRGTGTGIGGNIIFQTAAAGISGTSQNTLVKQLEVRGSGGINIGNGGSGTAPYIFPVTGASTTYASGGSGLCFYSYATIANEVGFVFGGSTGTPTSGAMRQIHVIKGFSPTSGTATYSHMELVPTINQTGGANGITRGLYINPTLTAAADFRALEISAGNIVLPKTVTAAGTTGAQTIDKVTGSVNLGIGATSLVVTDAYVTANSIIICTVGSNDTTTKSVAAVAAAGSFTIYPNAAPTAETRVNFHITN